SSVSCLVRYFSRKALSCLAVAVVRSGPATFSDFVWRSMPAADTEWQRLHFWARKIALPSGAAAAAAGAASAEKKGATAKGVAGSSRAAARACRVFMTVPFVE